MPEDISVLSNKIVFFEELVLVLQTQISSDRDLMQLNLTLRKGVNTK